MPKMRKLIFAHLAVFYVTKGIKIGNNKRKLRQKSTIENKGKKRNLSQRNKIYSALSIHLMHCNEII